MAARLQQSGDGFAAQISTMSKSQLYDLMCQVKVMIEQNQNQARQVLIDNPVLTRTLFQAQIMLGMVQPPKVMPNIQQVASQPELTQATKPESKPVAPAPTPAPALPPQSASASMPSMNLQPHPVPAQPNPLAQPLPSLQQQKPGNFLSAPPPSGPQQFNLPSHFGIPPGPQGGNFNQPPLHPPMSQQPRMQMPGMQQQFSNQMMMMPNSGMGFQPGAVSGPGPQQMMPPQPGFMPSGMSSSSFSQTQPTLPGQQPPQQMFQGGGSHMNIDYGMHSGMHMPSDRQGPWGAAGHPDMPSSARPQMPGLPPFMSNQIGQPMAGQAPRPHLTNEMQQALLDQVRSLTPDQINMLPPDQRQQVLQLQDMLR